MTGDTGVDPLTRLTDNSRMKQLLCMFALVSLAVPAWAQPAVHFDVGIHPGFPVTSTLRQAFCCTTSAGFISYETSDASYAAGLSAGGVFGDRLRVSLGATYMPVSFRSIGTSCCPISHPESSKHGTSWEFPLLADYQWLNGSVRPFAGGGMIVGSHLTGGAGQASGPVVTGGAEWAAPRGVILRPEFRYTHYSQHPGSNVAVGRPPTQIQILMGVLFRR